MIVIDDVGAIFGNKIALQILLAALGTGPEGSRKRLVKYKRAGVDKTVEFSGGIILISNLPLDGHQRELLAALRDRVQVLEFEPSDEQIIAVIKNIASEGVRGTPSAECVIVADFLIAEMGTRGVRPSIRLFVDKAIPDYQLYASGKSETHWKDLIVSCLKQQAIEPEHPTRDISRAENTEAERRLVLDICTTYSTPPECVAAWKERTGKGSSAFYRRRSELIRSGRLSPPRQEVATPA